MKVNINKLAAVSLAISALVAASAQAQEQVFKIGIVAFVSGSASDTFGVPAVNTVKLMVDQFNRGQVPAPYNKKGFAGMKVEYVVVDESGGPAKQVQEIRNLVEREKVDAILGYTGSSTCLAVAPIAEQLKQVTLFYTCGTPRIFEEASYKYVFRTAATSIIDNVALARYLKQRNVKVQKINMINQDYAWGHDSKIDFLGAMSKLHPGSQLGADLLPKFGAGQYGAEISVLSSTQADILYSSLWGGDLQAFLLQANARGLLKNNQLVLSVADHVLPGLGDKMPDGAVFGAAGSYGVLAAKNPLDDWYQRVHFETFKNYPVQAGYRMIQGLMGLKLAVENATEENGGKKPTQDQIASKLRGSSWNTPAGQIQMTLGNGQQAIQSSAIGKTKYDPQQKRVLAVDVQQFAAECVNPPANMKAAEWLSAGMPGAKCD
jgi:branched-chain amino acid transport system substrate-binding protein